MRKKISTVVLVLVLLAAAGAGASYWFGMQAQQAYDRIVTQLNAGGGVTLTTRSYERGLLSSQAETVASFRGRPVELLLSSRIDHGPLPFAQWLHGALSFTPVMAVIHTDVRVTAKAGSPPELAKTLAQLPPATLDTTLALNGDGRTVLAVPAVTRTVSPGVQVRWQGLSGTLAFDRAGTRVETHIESPGVTVTAPQGAVNASGLAFDSDTHKGLAGYWFGSASARVGQMDFGPQAQVRGIQFSSTSKPVGNTVTSTFSYRLAAVRADGRQYGPGILTVELRNLDAAALVRFNQEVGQVYRQALPPPQTQIMVFGKALNLAADLSLSKESPELDVTALSFKAGGDELTGKARFVVDGKDLKGQDVRANPMLLLAAVKGQGELTVPPGIIKLVLASQIRRDVEAYRAKGALTPAEAARLTPEAYARIVDQAYPLYMARNPVTRWLVKKGAGYEVTLAVDQGKVLVNGQPLAAGAAPAAPAAK